MFQEPRFGENATKGLPLISSWFNQEQEEKTVAGIARANRDIEEWWVRPEALASALIVEQESEEGAAIIDFGATTTTLSIFKNGRFLHNRVITKGGYDITRDLQSQRISFQHAELLKCKYGVAAEKFVTQSANFKIPCAEKEQGFVLLTSDMVARMIQLRLTEILTPIMKDIAHFEQDIQHVFITGGGSMLKGLVDYVTRCQQFLQRGRPVVDIAVFTGEEMPRRALTPDRLVPLLPGLFGPERVASERKRMANEGCPMEESPVGVRHSAGILDLKDWINPLHGYKYDSMNPEALKRWLSFLIDPTDADMPNYRVLVVPQGIMVSPETLEKIDSLKLFGITVITEPYQERALPGLPPDAILPEGIDFTHRENGRSHCFFLTNQTDSIRHFQAKFRTDSNVTLLMDPLTGQSLTFHEERQGDYCCVDIVLQQYGSVIAMCGLLMTDAEPVPQEMLPFRPIGENLTWDVTFHENGEHVKTRQLFDWSQSDNERIRYYSGHARYTTTFTMKKQDMEHASWWLLLPGLNDVGHVWLNGVDLGIVWTAPYQVLADKALHKGKNTLEIEVVNTWHNALRGADLGKAPYDGIWTNAKYRTTGDRLLPAGLLETPLLVKQPHGAFKAFFDN